MLLNAFKFTALLLIVAATVLVLDASHDKRLTVGQKTKECSVIALLLLLFVSNIAVLYYVALSALHLPS